MGCLSQLPICKTSCCRCFTILIPNMTADLKKYYRLHEGITVEGKRVFVHSKCSMLTKDGKCKIHFRGKPDVCKNGPTKADYITKGCIYGTEFMERNKEQSEGNKNGERKVEGPFPVKFTSSSNRKAGTD